MSLEAAVLALADAINNLAKAGGGTGAAVTSTAAATTGKGKKADAGEAKTGDVLPADDEKAWGVGHPEFDAAFNTTDGSHTKPFLEIGKNGGRDLQDAILTKFKVKRLSMVPREKLPALLKEIEAARDSQNV